MIDELTHVALVKGEVILENVPRIRDIETLVELGVDKNSTIVFPAPLMSTIGELGTFLAREEAAATARTRADLDSAIPTPRQPARSG